MLSQIQDDCKENTQDQDDEDVVTDNDGGICKIFQRCSSGGFFKSSFKMKGRMIRLLSLILMQLFVTVSLCVDI